MQVISRINRMDSKVVVYCVGPKVTTAGLITYLLLICTAAAVKVKLPQGGRKRQVVRRRIIPMQLAPGQ